jgi:multicomponent K+:H+ antiporter subunit D
MLLLTALLGLAVAVHATLTGLDRKGWHFHALFQFQLLGVNGAFLTGDLFNLFVFFEVLLIASYGLMLHGQGARRLTAGVQYVIVNLIGSTLFLIALGLLYGVTGTLNMADMAARAAALPAGEGGLLRAGGLLLTVVFGLKAALLPLHLWLPRTYAAAAPAVAALFAIMTKVGLYAIVRVFTLIFGGEAGELSNLVMVWLWPLALLTLGAAVIGALAARNLQVLLAYLVVASVGTLLAGGAIGSEQSLAAALYYLIHSTLLAGALFLLADLIARQRGELGTDLISAPALRQPLLLGAMFFAGAISVAGLPPFSGFLGKLMLLRSVAPGAEAMLLWGVVLVGGLGMLIALSRAGSLVFWRPASEAVGQAADPVRVIATLGLLLGSVVLVAIAAPLQAFVQATAAQLLDVAPYLQIIQGGAQ